MRQLGSIVGLLLFAAVHSFAGPNEISSIFDHKLKSGRVLPVQWLHVSALVEQNKRGTEYSQFKFSRTLHHGNEVRMILTPRMGKEVWGIHMDLEETLHIQGRPVLRNSVLFRKDGGMIGFAQEIGLLEAPQQVKIQRYFPRGLDQEMRAGFVYRSAARMVLRVWNKIR